MAGAQEIESYISQIRTVRERVATLPADRVMIELLREVDVLADALRASLRAAADEERKRMEAEPSPGDPRTAEADARAEWALAQAETGRPRAEIAAELNVSVSRVGQIIAKGQRRRRERAQASA